VSEKIPIVIDTPVLLNFFERVVSLRDKFQGVLFENFYVFVPASVISEATAGSKSSIHKSEITLRCEEVAPNYDKHDRKLLMELENRIDRG